MKPFSICSLYLSILMSLWLTSCSKKDSAPNGFNPLPPKAPDTTQTDNSGNPVSPVLVAQLGYLPAISTQFGDSLIDTTVSCVQWVRYPITDSGAAVDAVEFHHSACPNDGTPLGSTSLAFNVDAHKSRSSGGVDTYILTRVEGSTTVVVGQMQVKGTTANLEELCQFTNSGQTNGPYNSACYVVEEEGSYGSLYVP